jgi:hypothetical protein
MNDLKIITNNITTVIIYDIRAQYTILNFDGFVKSDESSQQLFFSKESKNFS